MNIERLEMMRVMMERVVAGSWTPDNSILSEVHRPTTLPLVVESVKLYSWRTKTDAHNACGFSACAVGHACFDEEFRKLGWSWQGDTPRFDDRSGWEAVRKFFDIDNSLADDLFLARRYGFNERREYDHLPLNVREAKMVANRIEYLIQHGKNKFNQKYGN